jgi:1-phosphofructokinase family hexose kinase
MILCVTLNPCLDKTLTVPAWRPGEMVRGAAVREVVGGKGNNVARALKRLGLSPRPITFLGGTVGGQCETLLRQDDDLEPLVARSKAETRVILTVRTDSTNDQTSFFDPDPAITSSEADAILSLVEDALRTGKVRAVTLSGSSPSPVTHELYSEMISLGRARAVPVFLDTYGPALRAIWGFWPEVVQLNRREAAAHLRVARAGDDHINELLCDWEHHGVICGVVTSGPEPVWIRLRGTLYRAFPPAIQAVNPIGSGDCLLAGLVDGWLAGLHPEDLVRHAVACAVANALVWDAGAINRADVLQLREQVRVEK